MYNGWLKLSESTAARRRVFLHLVDATDGITAETGEAGGQPQLSKNGAAWGNTSATLTAIGNGRYYVELTAGELDTLGNVQVRYKSANTAEAVASAQVVAVDPFAAAGMGLTNLDATVSSRASQTSVDTVDDFLDTEIAAIKAKTDNLPAAFPSNFASLAITAGGAVMLAAGQLAVKKNTQLANFTFVMVDSTDHVSPKTSLTVTATRSIDGGAFGACANAVAEIGNGFYKITLAASDVNGDVIALRFTATGADARGVTVITQA